MANAVVSPEASHEINPQPEPNPGSPGLATSSRRGILSPREMTLLLALLLVAATAILYEPSLHNFFVNYDDPGYVVDNTHVNTGLSWSNIEWAFKTTTEDNWHPLTWIAHMADVQMFGIKPAGHHFVNMMWHILNVLLLFLLLRKATGYVIRSAMVAALFALCPLNVESVAWIAELKSLISTAFLFLTFFAYGWYVQRPSAKRYLAVAASFTLGLLAKPMIVTLPFLLLLADYWPLERLGVPGKGEPGAPSFASTLLKLFVEKIPLFLLCAASAAVTLFAQWIGGALGSTVLLPMKYRVPNAIYSYLAYILKGLWPLHLAVFYPHPVDSLPLWKTIAAAVILLSISAVVWRYRERRYLLAGWLWYVGALIPVIGIVQVGRQAMADRYAYVPFIGLFVIAVWVTADFAPRFHVPPPALLGIALAVLSGYAYLSHVQIGYWRTSYSLFTHAFSVTEKNGVAEDNLGVAFVDIGRSDLAFPHFEAAVKDMPFVSTPHYDLGTLLQKQNHYDEAMSEYRLALQYTSDPDEASKTHNNLGALQLQQDDLPGALAEYNASLKIDANEPHSLLGRGTVEYRQGNLTAAHDDLARAAQLMPSGLTYYSLARVSEDQGDLESAKNFYSKALQLAPNMTEAQTRLNGVLQKLQQ